MNRYTLFIFTTAIIILLAGVWFSPTLLRSTTKLFKKESELYHLRINTNPDHAEIKLLNSKQNYHIDGVKLPAGQYQIHIQAEAYISQTLTITLSTENVTRSIMLKPQRPAGEVFQDTLQDGSMGPKMVVIPKGSFLMGDASNKGAANEQPVHPVNMQHSFALSQTEITFSDFEKFSQATQRDIPKDLDWGKQNRPVIYVSWNDARAYAKWLSQQTSQHYRLPSETEWEYAARAGSVTDYYWGNQLIRGKANCHKCTHKRHKKTLTVASFASNDFGLYDMHGNVWEWVEDCWHDSYQGAPTSAKPWTAENCKRAVLRGGAWNSNALFTRSAKRSWFNRSFQGYTVGMRLARDLPN